MNKKFISRQNGNSRVIVVFADWAMDWRPFKGLGVPGYDIAVIWDFSDLTFSWKAFTAYDEVCLVAWGMGVFAASLTVHEILGRVTKRIAVNGTLDPIDDNRGMPATAFHGLVNALSPGSLKRFYRRMCTSAEQYEAFFTNRPQRTMAEIAAELRDIETHTIFHAPQFTEWDLAVISRHDVIFPTQNQVRSWHGVVPVQFLEGGHLPDFSTLLPRLLIDKDGVRDRFERARGTYSSNADVQSRVARELLARFRRASGLNSLMGNIIEVGCGEGTLTRLYQPLLEPMSSVRLWDIVEPQSTVLENAKLQVCDAEVAIRRVPSESVTLLISSATVQWFNSPSSFLRQVARVLQPGGYAVISSYVNGNLHEVTDIVGNGLQLPPAAAWRTLVPDSLEVLVCESTIERLHFDSPRHLLEHLRQTGVTAVGLNGSPVVSARRLLDGLPPDSSGLFPLTYRPLYLILRKPDT